MDLSFFAFNRIELCETEQGNKLKQKCKVNNTNKVLLFESRFEPI